MLTQYRHAPALLTELCTQLRCEEVRGDKEAAESGWVEEADLATAVLAPTAQAEHGNVKPADCQGKVKKHTCNSVGMGMKVGAPA